MNELERAGRTARDAAAALTPVAEIEQRAGRMRRARAVRSGLGSVAVALALVVGVVGVFAGEESAEPVATVGEVDAVRLSLVFPEDASESRERVVLQQRLDAWGVEHSVTGEWPSLEVSVARAAAGDAAFVVGTAGRIVVVADPAPFECPMPDETAAPRERGDTREQVGVVLADALETFRNIGVLDQAISEIPAGTERETLQLERSHLLEGVRDAIVPIGRQRSCADAIESWSAGGGTPLAEGLLDPTRPPRVRGVSDWGGLEIEIASIDLAGTPIGPALDGGQDADHPASLFLDGWWIGVAGAAGSQPSTADVVVPAEKLAVLTALLDGGGYESAPTVTVLP